VLSMATCHDATSWWYGTNAPARRTRRCTVPMAPHRAGVAFSCRGHCHCCRKNDTKPQFNNKTESVSRRERRTQSRRASEKRSTLPRRATPHDSAIIFLVDPAAGGIPPPPDASRGNADDSRIAPPQVLDSAGPNNCKTGTASMRDLHSMASFHTATSDERSSTGTSHCSTPVPPNRRRLRRTDPHPNEQRPRTPSTQSFYFCFCVS